MKKFFIAAALITAVLLMTAACGLAGGAAENIGSLPVRASSFLNQLVAEDSLKIGDISVNNGRVTVSWTDPEGNAPYSVAYAMADTGDPYISQGFWAAGSQEESSTWGRSFTMLQLTPGNTYEIYVFDSKGNEDSTTYRVPQTSSFVDGKLKDTSIKVTIEPRNLSYGGDPRRAAAVKRLSASDMVSHMTMDGMSYGIMYKMTFPKLAKARNFLVQICFTAPNGMNMIAVAQDETFGDRIASQTYFMIGDGFFRELYDELGAIPTGTYRIDMYWEGMHVNTSTFTINP